MDWRRLVWSNLSWRAAMWSAPKVVTQWWVSCHLYTQQYPQVTCISAHSYLLLHVDVHCEDCSYAFQVSLRRFLVLFLNSSPVSSNMRLRGLPSLIKVKELCSASARTRRGGGGGGCGSASYLVIGFRVCVDGKKGGKKLFSPIVCPRRSGISICWVELLMSGNSTRKSVLAKWNSTHVYTKYLFMNIK